MLRSRVLSALVLAVVVPIAATGCALVGDDGHYSDTLVKYDDDKGEPNRYVDLDDGQAQLAIGSPDRHRIVVQWRDPDGSGWTEPETVWTDEKNEAIENTVRYGGGTVAIRQVYSTDPESDSDTDSVTVGIVCRERSCTAETVPGYGGEAQVTPDGRFVYLGQDEKGASLWTPDKGIHLAAWSGHPGFEYGVVSSSEPVLAPDGSLRVVGSEPSRESCTFDLFAGAPGTADLTRVGRTTQPLRGPGSSDCYSDLETYSNDWVTVDPSDPQGRAFWFVRKGGDEWAASDRDPSGLRPVAVGRGCCDSSFVDFVHWNDVTFGSPDGRRIQVQTHLLGDETWSEPQLLDGATRGFTCTWMDGYEVGEHGFAVLMVCHSGKVRDELLGDAYAVAATPDLANWESAFVTDVREEPVLSEDRVEVGDISWTPDGGFER
jgi:hypothetical protein